MHPHRFVFLCYILSVILFSTQVFSQNTIPAGQPVDSMAIDTTVVDTIVVRRIQEQIDIVPRGVDLVHPVAVFKQTKAVTKPIHRFRVPSFWTNVNQLNINFSEVAFLNWNAGGNNSITTVGNLKFDRNYKFRYIQWDNYMDLRYGLNLQEGQKLRKTEDAIRLSSTFGFQRDTISNWYYSVKANFNTQFSNGYKYPNRETPISRFMAPGYSFLGAGTSYITKDQKFNLYLSPITWKTTFVLDEELANRGSFGVQKAIRDMDGNIIKPGEQIFMEFGFLLTNQLEKQLYENMLLKSRLSLYTDYLRDFGNVDVDWELNLNLRVNQYIAASLGTHVIYDDNILFDEVLSENGAIMDPGEPRIQFKQLLGIGVSYDF